MSSPGHRRAEGKLEGVEEPQAAGQQGEPLVSERCELQWHLALCQPLESKKGCGLTSTFQILHKCPSWLTLTWNHDGEGILGNIVPAKLTMYIQIDIL